MPPSADVCVLLPTLNESATIVDVIRAYQEAGFNNILVVDGGSGDDTRELSQEAGAAVITQSGEGKGQAIREAVGQIEADYVLMADADMTYRAEDAERMLEPLLVGDFEHVIGNRFADMEPGAMTKLNRIGNRLINRGFQFIHGEDYRDILSGYRAFRTDSFEQLTLSADGFGIETEMAVECAKNGVKTEVVPITLPGATGRLLDEPSPDQGRRDHLPGALPESQKQATRCSTLVALASCRPSLALDWPRSSSSGGSATTSATRSSQSGRRRRSSSGSSY